MKEKLKVQMERLAAMKQQAKHEINDRKKMLAPYKKELTAIKKMEGDLKVAKLPEAMQGAANPMVLASQKLGKLIDDLEFHTDDGKEHDVKVQLDKAVKECQSIRKMMRPFC